MPSVDELRSQLKSLGYLSHRLERWFILDPWSSRTFWQELMLVAVKGATLLAFFTALPAIAVMLVRNPAMGPYETAVLGGLYVLSGFLLIAGVIIGTALLLKLRPDLAIDSPRVLNGAAIAAAFAIVFAMAGWWSRFDRPPSNPEILLGLGSILLFFVVAVIVFSAAFLSFSIHEAHRLPSVRQSSRTVSITFGAGILLVLLFATANSAGIQEERRPPAQIPITPTTARIAFLGVDGMTWELLSARPDLQRALPYRARVAPLPYRASPERWASVATGTEPQRHGLHAVEGVRLVHSATLLQSVSSWDLILLRLAEIGGIAERQALPPTVRTREYLWEIVSGRGVQAAAVNWWATEDLASPTLTVVSQRQVFSRGGEVGKSAPAETALAIDRLAVADLLQAIDSRRPQLAAVYLPALDIVVNRIPSDEAGRFGRILRATDSIAGAVRELRARGYETFLVGMPGDLQPGSAIVASSMAIDTREATAEDLAPTILNLLGFPRSDEMPGRSLVSPAAQRTIPSYGTRARREGEIRVDPEYYEKLRSLGYIR